VGLREIIEQIRASVSAIVPLTQDGYRFDSPRPGVLEAPDDWLVNPDRETRQFDVYVQGPGVRGGGCLLRSTLEIAIVYRLDQDHSEVGKMIGEDAGLISSYLVQTPAAWSHADSLFAEGPEVDSIEYDNGRPATRIVRFPVVVDYREDDPGITASPLVLEFAEAVAHRANLYFQVVDQYGSPVSAVTEVALAYTDADGIAVAPTFWADPSKYPTTIAVGTRDVAATVKTDDSGFCHMLLMYEGIDLSSAQVVSLAIGSSVSRTDEVNLSGSRVFVDTNNPAAVDATTSGSEAVPYKTLDYAFDRVEASKWNAQDVAICIVSDATYPRWTSSTPGYGPSIVGLSGGIVVTGDVRTTSAESPTIPLFRNVEVTSGMTVEAASNAYLSGVRFSGYATYQVRPQADGLRLMMLGCEVASGGTYSILFGSETAAGVMMHCTTLSTGTAPIAGSYYNGTGFSIFDCTITATAQYFINGRNAQNYAGDRNAFSGTASVAFSRLHGRENATLAAHQASTGQDLNSTHTP